MPAPIKRFQPTHRDVNGLLVELEPKWFDLLAEGKTVKAFFKSADGLDRAVLVNMRDYEQAGLKPLNASERERENILAIAADMPVAEKAKFDSMVMRLMASVGNPITGNTFMLAVALVNCEVACSAIALGVVNEDGSFKEAGKDGN